MEGKRRTSSFICRESMKILSASAAAAAAAVVLLNLAVPPFQSPDEPHHFAAIMLQARGEAAREAVERETIALMDRFDWWRHIGLGRPAEMPERLSDIPFLMDRWGGEDFLMRLDGFTLFHRLAGLALRPFGRWDLGTAYLFCRAACLLLFAAGLALVWGTAGILGGRAAEGGAFVFLAAALVPQFLMTGAAVTADVFVFFLGAAFFRGAAALIAGKGRFFDGALVLLPAGLGFLVDRSAFVFGILFLLLPLFAVRRRNFQTAVTWTLLFAIFFILLVYFTALRFPLQVERGVLRLKQVLDGAKAAGLGGMLPLDGEKARFWAFMGDSFYLRFGWLVYAAPGWVYWAWRAVLGAAAVGLAVGAAGGMWRKAVASLLVLGVSGLGEVVGGKDGRRRALAVLAMVLVVLLGYVVWHDVVPAFHLVRQGPYPGI